MVAEKGDQEVIFYLAASILAAMAGLAVIEGLVQDDGTPPSPPPPTTPVAAKSPATKKEE